MRTLCLMLVALVCWTPGCGAESSFGENAAAPKYLPGQVWTYYTRHGEEGSRLVILRIDADPKLGSIIHAYIDGVAIKNPHTPSGIATEIGHLPFAEEAIDRSVLQQVGTRPLPDFQEGYDTWREAFENGEGGIFTITAREAVDYVEQALNQAG